MKLELFLVILGCLFVGIGGILDILEGLDSSYTKRNFLISKQHFWNDGLFIVLLAIFICIYKNQANLTNG
jgi:hypothetical protein